VRPDNHLADSTPQATVGLAISNNYSPEEESTMTLYGGIDLHLNNNVVALTDMVETD
jgi:hypothetical protein